MQSESLANFNIFTCEMSVFKNIFLASIWSIIAVFTLLPLTHGDFINNVTYTTEAPSGGILCKGIEVSKDLTDTQCAYRYEGSSIKFQIVPIRP